MGCNDTIDIHISMTNNEQILTLSVQVWIGHVLVPDSVVLVHTPHGVGGTLHLFENDLGVLVLFQPDPVSSLMTWSGNPGPVLSVEHVGSIVNVSVGCQSNHTLWS